MIGLLQPIRYAIIHPSPNSRSPATPRLVRKALRPARWHEAAYRFAGPVQAPQLRGRPAAGQQGVYGARCAGMDAPLIVRQHLHHGAEGRRPCPLCADLGAVLRLPAEEDVLMTCALNRCTDSIIIDMRSASALLLCQIYADMDLEINV